MLSPEAARYIDDGYLVVDAVFSEAEIVELRDDVVAFARGRYPLTNPPAVSDDADDEVAMQSLLAVHFPHWVSDVTRRAVRHPGLARVLGEITGAHLPFWDGSVKCMQTMLFVKGPGMPGQAWHQDERYIPTRDRSLVGAWVALDDATTDNGCLWVMPGSHRMGYLWPCRAHGRPEDFDVADEAYGFDDSGARPVEIPAGSVVFLNGYLLHRSLPNRTAGYRRSLVLHYCNAWSLLPWTAGAATEVSSATIATMDYRGATPLGDDPYADRGRTPNPSRVFARPRSGSWADARVPPAGP